MLLILLCVTMKLCVKAPSLVYLKESEPLSSEGRRNDLSYEENSVLPVKQQDDLLRGLCFFVFQATIKSA